MVSPFAQLANATIVFDVPTDSSVGESGSPLLRTEKLIAIAYLVENRTRIKQPEDLKDGQMDRIRYGKGSVWVLPMKAPTTLQAEQVGPAYIWRVNGADRFRLPEDGFADMDAYNAFLATNRAVSSRLTAEGFFVLQKTPADPYGVADATGDRFEGYLQVQTAWGDSV